MPGEPTRSRPLWVYFRHQPCRYLPQRMLELSAIPTDPFQDLWYEIESLRRVSRREFLEFARRLAQQGYTIKMTGTHFQLPPVNAEDAILIRRAFALKLDFLLAAQELLLEGEDPQDERAAHAYTKTIRFLQSDARTENQTLTDTTPSRLTRFNPQEWTTHPDLRPGTLGAVQYGEHEKGYLVSWIRKETKARKSKLIEVSGRWRVAKCILDPDRIRQLRPGTSKTEDAASQLHFKLSTFARYADDILKILNSLLPAHARAGWVSNRDGSNAAVDMTPLATLLAHGIVEILPFFQASRTTSNE